MPALLHIHASPRGEESYSLRVAKALLKEYSQAHPSDTVRTLDLFAESVPEFGREVARGKYKILHGREQTEEEQRAWQAVTETIADFTSADRVLVSSPMWNFSIPYRLKQYIDVIVQPTLTFSFSPETGYTGLVTGRPAALILARGGEYVPGTGAAVLDQQRPYLEAILRFIGFADITTIVVEPTLLRGPDVAQQKLDEATAKARDVGRSF